MLYQQVTIGGVKLRISILEEGLFKSKVPRYNILEIAGSSLGFRHGPETKQKISEAHKGKELTPETKQKISEALSGKELSLKTKTKISEAQKGKSPSPETRAKISGSLGIQIYVYDTQGSRR